MSSDLLEFKHFLSKQHIPYSYALWLDFEEWYDLPEEQRGNPNLTEVENWFSINKHRLLRKVKDDQFKTWLYVCKDRVHEETANVLFSKYNKLKEYNPAAIRGANRYQRMKNFLDDYEKNKAAKTS